MQNTVKILFSTLDVSIKFAASQQTDNDVSIVSNIVEYELIFSMSVTDMKNIMEDTNIIR